MILGFVFSCIATKLTFRARRIAHAKIAGPIHQFPVCRTTRRLFDLRVKSRPGTRIDAFAQRGQEVGRLFGQFPVQSKNWDDDHFQMKLQKPSLSKDRASLRLCRSSS
jgi:hypothetical protein